MTPIKPLYADSVRAMADLRTEEDRWTLADALYAEAGKGNLEVFERIRLTAIEAGVKSYAANSLRQYRDVAARCGADHHELELSFARQDVELSELSWHLDEPLADLSSLGFLALSKLAAETVTVALAGQGADELLGGYSRHRNAALAARVPARLRRPLSRERARGRPSSTTT